MSSLFGEVWFWSLLAFLIGAILTWVLLVRPAQQRSQQLEQRSRQLERRAQQQAPAPPAEPVEPQYRQPDAAEWPAPPSEAPAEHHPRTQWLEHDSLPSRGSIGYPDDVEVEELTEAEGSYADDYPESGGYPARTAYAERDYADVYPEQREYEPALPDAGFDALEGTAITPPVEPEEALPTQRVQPEAYAEATQAVEPAEVEDYTQRITPSEPAEALEQAPAPEPQEHSGFFDEEQPTTAVGTDGKLADVEPDFDPATGLPKRTRGASSRIRGGFEPPKPIQPSVRPIARRTPSDTTVATGGSLFEPGASESGHHAPPARSAAQTAAPSVPPGPFGPGSAMPLPGGGRPDPGFTVKGSVTALRYCPEDSPRFGEMVAEVWFASVADAERVGFRPLG